MRLFEIPMFVAPLFGLCLLSGLDTPPAYADFAVGEPVNLKTVIPVIDPAHESVTCLSYDGLEMYLASYRPGGSGGEDMWVIRRASTKDGWEPPENLGPAINSPKDDEPTSISGDGLTLYFHSTRDGGYGWSDLYMTTRANRNEPWGPVVNLGPPISGPSGDGGPCISSDGLELYFTSWRTGGFGGGDLYVSRRATTNDPWGQPENLGPLVNSPHDEVSPKISPDGLVLFFADWMQGGCRPGGYGGADIWVTRRASQSDRWEAAVNLGPLVNGPGHEVVPCLSRDGSMLYFASKTAGIWDNWQAPILPVVDFNGDGQVDGRDLLIMIVEFGGTDALCDIGPYAWGDGVVDFEDFKVLAEYIGKEVEDPTLAAHWPLDETDGMTACDMASEDEATVVGNAVWQPEGGRIGGALAFDGVDDFVLAHCPAGLGDGPFSILAWVKGGAPDEVIVSNGRTDWLYTNPADGSLTTALAKPGRTPVPLFSDVVITDGRWHRIGLVWDGDGVDRILLVDEQEVARDEQGELVIPDAGLIIGAGATPGCFFSGLIDDVRIYNRVVKP